MGTIHFLIQLTSGDQAPVVIQQPVSDGKKRVRDRRKRYSADDELTHEEVHFIRRKLTELKKAKSERERADAEKALAESIAAVAESEAAQDAIAETIIKARPEADILKSAMTLAELGRDMALLDQIVAELGRVADGIERERERIREEEALVILMAAL